MTKRYFFISPAFFFFFLHAFPAQGWYIRDSSSVIYSGRNGDAFRSFVFHAGTFTRTDSVKGKVERISGRTEVKNDVLFLYRDSSKTAFEKFIFCDPHYDRNCVPERVWSLCSFPLYYERIVDMADMMDYTRSDKFPLCRKNKMIRFEWKDPQYGKQERELPVRLMSQDNVPFVSVEYIMRNIDFIYYSELFVDTLHGTPFAVKENTSSNDSNIANMFNFNSSGKTCVYDSLRRLIYISTYGPVCNTCFDGFNYSISYNGNSGKPAEISSGDYLKFKFYYRKNGSVERVECWNYTTLLSELRVSE